MPQTIDEEKFEKQETLDMSKPQGTAHGIPVKQIPHMEYPKCVYRHPVEPYREVLHRNTSHEVVERELVATEHKVHVCQNAEEHKKKLSEGWVAEPYIPQAPPDPTEALYSKVTEEVTKRIGKKQATDDPKLDLVAAQKFLQSRGYQCDDLDDAQDFINALKTKDRAGFLKELGEFIANGNALEESDPK
jgi:hypothetical protein